MYFARLHADENHSPVGRNYGPDETGRENLISSGQRIGPISRPSSTGKTAWCRSLPTIASPRCATLDSHCMSRAPNSFLPHEIRAGALHSSHSLRDCHRIAPGEVAIPGLKQAGYLTSDEMLDVRQAPSSLLVLGRAGRSRVCPIFLASAPSHHGCSVAPRCSPIWIRMSARR